MCSKFPMPHLSPRSSGIINEFLRDNFRAFMATLAFISWGEGGGFDASLV